MGKKGAGDCYRPIWADRSHDKNIREQITEGISIHSGNRKEHQRLYSILRFYLVHLRSMSC